MKQQHVKMMLGLLALLPIMLLVSCNDEPKKKDGDDSFQPVLNENFSFELSGNNVNFTTEITGNVWVTVNDTDYSFEDQKVTVNLPKAGTYTFTCSSLGSGDILTSDPFEVEISQDDLSFLSGGMWKYLTGGPDGGKIWVLDLETKYFHAIADYYGDAEAGATDGDAWGPWGGGYVSEYDLGGEISFDGVSGQATMKFNGATETGNFTFTPKERPAASDYMTYATETQFDLWETGFVNGPYSYLPLSDSIATVEFTGEVHFPLDSSRYYNNAAGGENGVNASQFLDEDLKKVDIVHLSDSALVLRVKRTYEGDDESKVWMLYNYIVKDYTYSKEQFTYSEPVDADFAQADLEGTWQYTAIPFDWVGWKGIGDRGSVIDPVPLNNWADVEALKAVEWLGVTQTQLDSAYKEEYVFGNDGSATVGLVATTYSVNAGVITFADSVTFGIGDHWYAVKNTKFKVLEIPGQDGIWIGVQNGDKSESQAFHLAEKP